MQTRYQLIIPDTYLTVIRIIRTNLRKWCALEAGRQQQSFVLIAFIINIIANKCDLS